MTDAARACAKIVFQQAPQCVPQVGIILGSGLGVLGDQLKNSTAFSYENLPGFPECRVEGHRGQLKLGWLEGVPVACLQGRGHFYEGCSADNILTYVRTLKLLGCHSVIITGAVGSLCPEVGPGNLVVLKDHINFQGRNVLVGVNDDEVGPRFPDMIESYDRELRKKIETVAHDLSIPLSEGIYISVLGPSFETPAEIRAFRLLGADVVGMSVVPEVIAARHCGMSVLGLTVVTNLAAGLTNAPLSHHETVTNAEQAAAKMVRLIKEFVREISG